MIALAHVETARVADIVRVGEVDLLLGPHRFAPVARLFERNAALVTARDIEEGAAIGAEQPLVGRERHEVGIERAHVEFGHADTVGGVDEQRRALRAKRRGDAGKIDRATIRPMHRRDRHERERRSARPRDGCEHRGGPVAVSAAGFDREALGARARQPFQHGGGMIVRQHQDARAFRHAPCPVILAAVATP